MSLFLPAVKVTNLIINNISALLMGFLVDKAL